MTFNFDKVPAPNNWAIAIFCALLLILTVEVVQYRRKLSLLVKSLFSQRHFSLLLREGKFMEELPAFVLLFADLASYAFGLLIILDQFHHEIVSQLTYIGCWGILWAGLLLLYWAKFLCHRVYAALYDYDREVYAMNLYKFAFLTDTSMLLFPISIVAAFTNTFACLYAFIPLFFAIAFVWVFKMSFLTI